MAHTGLFEILNCELSQGEVDAPCQISACTYRCCNCSGITSSTDDHLEQVPGGVALKCPSCGKRQAISAARFDGLLERFRRVGSQD